MYDLNSMTFWKRQDYGENRTISDFQGLWRRERMNRRITEDF